MFGVMLQKLWHKKWMAFSLLVGITLLVATAVSFPMYRSAAYNRMLQDEFNAFFSENGEWPGKNCMVIISKKDNGGNQFLRWKNLQQEFLKNLV